MEKEINYNGTRELPTLKEFITVGLLKSKDKERNRKNIFKTTMSGFYIKLKQIGENDGDD